jgi:Ca2+-transporting ATPase
MTVIKACICGKIKEVDGASDAKSLSSELPDSVMTILSQSIFNNTGGDVVWNQDGKREILGTPTETAILEFGLSLGGDFSAVRKASTLVKVEPFNSAKKRMGVVIQLPEGALRAHCKGASEIILASCSKYLNEEGDVIPLDEGTIDHLKATIDSFANEALRTLCLAYMEVEDGFSVNDQIPTDGYTCIGIVGIKDPVRPGVKESVAICRSAGITVRMVTGDNINTAKAIARECGILTEGGIAIEGPDFRTKSEEELTQLIPKIQVSS